ncbi:O-antigen ligase family protein [Psychroflexus halocasei]|nr:O-antigen ligase family protein [Psychroflexus halocasei]
MKKLKRKSLNLKKYEKKYAMSIFFHLVIGFLVYVFKPLALLYMLGIFVYFIAKITSNPQQPLLVLKAAAYITGAEVLLRMTGGFVFYETGKYAVVLFMLFGMFYHGFKKKAIVFIFYIAMLLPAIYVTFLEIGYEVSFQKYILFNLSGPISLTVAALFCYGRKLSLQDFFKIMDIMILPVISMTVYLIFYTPDLESVIVGSQSNFAASGGFGPNQVSTILGLAMFYIGTRLFIPYKSNFLQILMIILLVIISFRALATLSRGGVLTAAIMLSVFVLSLLIYAKAKIKVQTSFKLLLLMLGVVVVIIYTAAQTNEQLYNRYTNKNASGIEKEDVSAGRFDVANAELEMFEQNPVFGVGVGMGKDYRLANDLTAASHNEITRVISEHGTLGLISFLVLLLVPGFKILLNPRNLYMIPLVIFWGATINHSAMRVAAPGFIYGLALLSVTYPTKKSKKARKNKIHAQKNIALSR